MNDCMFCNRGSDKLYGDKIKYCEHCKSDIERVSVGSIIKTRKDELKGLK